MKWKYFSRGKQPIQVLIFTEYPNAQNLKTDRSFRHQVAPFLHFTMRKCTQID